MKPISLFALHIPIGTRASVINVGGDAIKRDFVLVEVGQKGNGELAFLDEHGNVFLLRHVWTFQLTQNPRASEQA